ncbi:hypothetical protein [Diadegma fenestrale ichnovirus]|nr:hypothetical protein [Diadegma fenestrale ichnovirus]
MPNSCFSEESEGILNDLLEVTLGVDCMMNNMEGRCSGSSYYRRPWWLDIFILAAQRVREERLEMRIARDRLWREDRISREFDELCPDEVPGDLLGLRRLFDMEQFPGLVEHEAWTAIWEFFIARPSLMLFALRFYGTKLQTPKPLIDSNPPSFKPRMASNGGGPDQNADRFVSFRNFLAVNSALDSQSPKH